MTPERMSEIAKTIEESLYEDKPDKSFRQKIKLAVNANPTFEAFEKIRQRHETTFENGAKATLEFFLGAPIAGWGSPDFQQAIRLGVFPKNKLTEQEQKKLVQHKVGRDLYEPGILGSVGYLGFTVERLRNSITPAIFVWNTQMRALPELSKQTQRAYRNWDVEAIKTLEKEARKLGITKIAILIPTFYGPRKIKQQYVTLTAKLASRGYVQKSIIPAREAKHIRNLERNGTLKIIVKNLNL